MPVTPAPIFLRNSHSSTTWGSVAAWRISVTPSAPAAASSAVSVPVTDASKIPELLETIHRRSWLHGEGWAFVGVGGGLHERSLVDTALGRPAQPDFAAPDLRDGLTQDREWNEFTGEHLDPASVAPLTAEEEAEYQKAVAVAKDALAADMKAAREDWLAEQSDKAMERGVSPKRAMAAAIQRLDNGVLFPTDTIIFGDGTDAPVLELLTDGSAHDGKTCKDPVEPDYNSGASVGVFYWNDGGKPGIHSFAHGPRWYAIKHDVTSLEAVISEGVDEAVHRSFVLTIFASNTEKLRLERLAAKTLGLGNNVKAFRADVAAVKKRFRGNDGERGLEATALATINDGRWPIDQPLPPEMFPFDKDGKLLGHQANYEFLLGAYGIEFAYDMISKKLLWSASGLDTETDNADLALFSRIKSLAALNGIPSGSDALNAFLPAIAEVKQVNRVRDYLKDLGWDGKDRFKKLAKSLGSHDREVALISIARWLIQACAAADGAEMAQSSDLEVKPVYEYVLVLLGDQGVGKTKGLSNIVPSELRFYLKESVVLNTNNKDSVKLAVSGWIAELGELDATFRAADHVAFKAFMSREHDELRMPYAAKTSRFRRRTVFVGSVNEPEFLKDKTGARRFFPLSVDQGFPAWPDAEIDQLWAQAWSMYASGEQWWPTTDEVVRLSENSERFRQKSWAEQKLEAGYEWALGPEGSARKSLASVWEELVGCGSAAMKMSSFEQSDLGHALRRLWEGNGAYKLNGVLVMDTDHGTVRVNSTDGKNRGWLLPPGRVPRWTRATLTQVKPTGRPFWERGRSARR